MMEPPLSIDDVDSIGKLSANGRSGFGEPTDWIRPLQPPWAAQPSSLCDNFTSRSGFASVAFTPRTGFDPLIAIDCFIGGVAIYDCASAASRGATSAIATRAPAQVATISRLSAERKLVRAGFILHLPACARRLPRQPRDSPAANSARHCPTTRGGASAEWRKRASISVTTRALRSTRRE